jgi:hypothetical protein
MAKKNKCPIMEPDPFRVWVNWEYTYCSGGGICEGEEDDAYPSREPEEKDHEVHGVYSCDAKDGRGWSRYNESIDVGFEPVTGAEVFLVVVTYGTGDTFGHSSGNVSIVGCYEEEAHSDSIAADIRFDDDNSRYGEMKKGRKERFSGYKAWTGYFESLEGVEVHRLRLDEAEGVKRF